MTTSTGLWLYLITVFFSIHFHAHFIQKQLVHGGKYWNSWRWKKSSFFDWQEYICDERKTLIQIIYNIYEWKAAEKSILGLLFLMMLIFSFSPFYTWMVFCLFLNFLLGFFFFFFNEKETGKCNKLIVGIDPKVNDHTILKTRTENSKENYIST